MKENKCDNYPISLNNIKVITLQIKVRRLNYIKMILNLFNKSNYYPRNIFNKKIELEATKINDYLKTYTNTKGIIEITKTGNSAKPYIVTALYLKLLYIQNNQYQLSKYGKIFNVLNDKLQHSTNNYFELSKYEKSFYLFFIFQNDNLYLWSLLDLISRQDNKTTIKNIKEVFQDYIIKQLQFITKSSNISDKYKIQIHSQIKRIKSWRNAKLYLTHIIEPRVNWLLDLDILDKDEFKKKKIVLSKEGLTLYHTLSPYFDRLKENYMLLYKLKYEDFFNIIDKVYDIEAINENNIELIEKYIDESFSLFKTIAPNRITASQAILYTCFMMLFKAKKVVNFCTIQHYLNSKENTKFIFDWYKTENDGSIRKRSK